MLVNPPHLLRLVHDFVPKQGVELSAARFPARAANIDIQSRASVLRDRDKERKRGEEKRRGHVRKDQRIHLHTRPVLEMDLFPVHARNRGALLDFDLPVDDEFCAADVDDYRMNK